MKITHVSKAPGGLEYLDRPVWSTQPLFYWCLWEDILAFPIITQHCDDHFYQAPPMNANDTDPNRGLTSGVMCQMQVSRAGISDHVSQNLTGRDYLSLPLKQCTSFGTTVLTYALSWYRYLKCGAIKRRTGCEWDSWRLADTLIVSTKRWVSPAKLGEKVIPENGYGFINAESTVKCFVPPVIPNMCSQIGASILKAVRRLTTRSCEVSKPRDSC